MTPSRKSLALKTLTRIKTFVSSEFSDRFYKEVYKLIKYFFVQVFLGPVPETFTAVKFSI